MEVCMMITLNTHHVHQAERFHGIRVESDPGPAQHDPMRAEAGSPGR